MPLIVDSEAELARMLQTLQAERFLAFRVFNEELRSYKGYCTWIGVHSRHGIHLVDTVRLRDSQNELRMVACFPNSALRKSKHRQIGNFDRSAVAVAAARLLHILN